MPPPIPRCSNWAYSSLNSPSCFSLPRYGSRIGLHIFLCEACSTFTRVAACTLALSPIRDTLIEGFSHFVTSMTAPIASGWSGCRVGRAPTGERRLVTAHTHLGHPTTWTCAENLLTLGLRASGAGLAMKRREFVTLVGGAVAWPLAAGAQPVRRVAVVIASRESDPEGQARLKAFLEGFQQLGWIDGRNVRIETRWTNGSRERTGEIASEFAALAPDVIVVNSALAMAAVKRATSSIPVVFMMVNDPVVQGFITSMARPGGNITGFSNIDFSLLGKWMEMLKTVAPTLTRVGLMFNPETYPYYDAYLQTFQHEMRLVEVTRAAVRSPADIDTAVAAIAAQPGGGLAIAADPFTTANLAQILTALRHHGLPHT